MVLGGFRWFHVLVTTIKKNTSNKDKRITNEKNSTRKQEMCLSCAVL